MGGNGLPQFFQIVLENPAETVPHHRFRRDSCSVHPQLTHIWGLRGGVRSNDIADIGNRKLSNRPHGNTSLQGDYAHEGSLGVNIGVGHGERFAGLATGSTPGGIDKIIKVFEIRETPHSDTHRSLPGSDHCRSRYRLREFSWSPGLSHTPIGRQIALPPMGWDAYLFSKFSMCLSWYSLSHSAWASSRFSRLRS